MWSLRLSKIYKIILPTSNFWTGVYKHDLKQELFKWVDQKQETSQFMFYFAVKDI